MVIRSRAKTIAFLSGVGGTGRTTAAVGLARHLAGLGQKALLFDFCFGWGGLGLERQKSPSYAALLDTDEHIEDAVIHSKTNYDILTCLPPPVLDPSIDDFKKIVWLADRLTEKYDYLILDPPSGGHPLSLLAAGLSDLVMLFTRPDGASVTSSYHLLKSLNAEGIASKVGAVISFVDSARQAASVKTRLDILAGQIPVSKLHNFGFIPRLDLNRGIEIGIEYAAEGSLDTIGHLNLAAIAMLQNETAAKAIRPAFRGSAKVGR